MLAIYKRELRSCFHSFIGWLYLAVTVALMGVYFYICNMLIGYPTISYLLQMVVFLNIFTIPILTMRSMSEERKNKTDQLILTAPVSVGRIVMGKYLALVTVYAVPLIILGITPLLLSQAGSFQIGLSYSSLLGFFLYGCLGLALGMFVSSLTESVVVSAILGLVVMFAGYIMGGITSIISSSGTSAFAECMVRVLNCFDMVRRFDILSSGYFEVESVAYYVTFTAFMLFCTVQSIQKRRYAFAGRGVGIGAFSIVNIMAAAAVVVLVNIGLNYIPDQYTSYDVTVNKIFTLTEESVDYVRGLTQDVTIYVWADEESKDGDLDKLLGQLKGYSDHIRVEYVSPIANPMFYYNYTDIQPSANSLIVVGEHGNVVVDYNDMYIYQTNYTTYEEEVVGTDAEGQVISAIMRASSEDTAKVYIVAGHDELMFDDTFLNALSKENVSYESLQLYAVDAVPEDADVLVFDAPVSDYSDDDVEKVLAYLEQGGSAFIIPTWTDQDMTGFEKILDYYGISLVDGVIMETDRSHYYQTVYDLFPNIEYNDITQTVYDGTVFAPLCRGLIYDEESEDIRYVPILTTSDQAFSKKDVLNAQNYNKSSEDIDGPFVIAMTAERPVSDQKTSKAAVVATEQMFTAQADNIVPGYNVKLFGNIVASLTEQEVPVVVPVKYYEIGNLVFSAGTVLTVIIGIIAAVVLCLAAGIWIPLRRRRK